MECVGGTGGTVLHSAVAASAGNGGGGRRRRGRRRRWRLQAVGGGSADRRIDAGGPVVIYELVNSSQNQFTESREERQSTARSTFVPMAMKCQDIEGSHGFIFRHTSLNNADCDLSRMQNEVG